jgi:hypothetical protein
MKGFALEALLSDIGDKIDPYQFAMNARGYSTTQALIFLNGNP